jgi:hypothetical protein
MKVLSIAVFLFFSFAFAENSTSANQTKSSNEKPAVVSDDEELIIGDDEDIQKATKQESAVPDTTKRSAVPAVPAATVKSSTSTGTVPAAKPSTTAAPASSVTPGAQATTDKVDDELKLDGEEESILEPVKQEVIAADTNSGKGISTVDKGQVSDSSASNQVPDSTVSTPSVRGGRGSVPPAETAFVKKHADPQAVGVTGSINFAKNMKDYRSPKLAMLMSLVLPGSGQVYAAHHSWKAAIYGVVEVGMIATSAVLRTKGIKKENDAHKYADQHYNMDKYLNYQRVLKSHVDTATYSNIFYGSDTFFLNEARTKDQGYYSKIESYDQPFVNGWDDALPGFDENLAVVDSRYKAVKDSAYLVYLTDSTKAYYGFSNNQKTYSSKLSASRRYFSSSGMVLAFMLVNHLVSAIDAGLSAKAHNDLLLNKKSVWNHIGLEQICLSDGRQMVPGYALKVRF